jgi:hypothetical protein
MSKVGVPEHEENDITPSDIKAAQGIAGELLWLSVRSRPDISFSVGQIGRQVSHHPKWALQVGRGVLEYLASTPNHGLVYGPSPPIMVWCMVHTLRIVDPEAFSQLRDIRI